MITNRPMLVGIGRFLTTASPSFMQIFQPDPQLPRRRMKLGDLACYPSFSISGTPIRFAVTQMKKAQKGYHCVRRQFAVSEGKTVDRAACDPIEERQWI